VLVAAGVGLLLLAAACSEKSTDLTGADPENVASSTPGRTAPGAGGPEPTDGTAGTSVPATTVAPVEGGTSRRHPRSTCRPSGTRCRCTAARSGGPPRWSSSRPTSGPAAAAGPSTRCWRRGRSG